ncbi:MAG TPA: NYN domain-containing protein [Flavitalea sp.]|nr:NYN domain-containing protein [Flavitalea sp.]
MDMINELKLAVLIDADNIPYSNIKGMMEEIAKYGTPTFKRIYGDWTRPSLSGWKGVLLENAITPIQQYSYTKGKNSTDSALIIDAMDILYTAQVDGFCIISSDSDFTRLATRLREAGKKVFGMGEKKTPMSFIASCNKFIYIEILQTDVKAVPARPATSRVPKERVSRHKATVDNVVAEKAAAEKVAAERVTADRVAAGKVAVDRAPADTNGEDRIPADRPAEDKSQANRTHAVSQLNDAVIRLISESITALAEEDGWVGLAVLGALIIKKQPDFDPRNYGFKKLVELVKSIPQIEIDKRETSRNNVSHFYVRLRENTND